MTIKLTKNDAARRQIETAITLWFHDGDPVSVHTLASAALQIVHDLGEAEGVAAMAFDPQHYREETFQEWVRIAREAQNFFKHADRDPDQVLDFRATYNEFLLSDCVDTYHRLFDERTPVMIVFWNYFIVHHPQYFDPSVVGRINTASLEGLPKQQFFRECLPIAQAKNLYTP